MKISRGGITAALFSLLAAHIATIIKKTFFLMVPEVPYCLTLSRVLILVSVLVLMSTRSGKKLVLMHPSSFTFLLNVSEFNL